jgi:hypothetical protein
MQNIVKAVILGLAVAISMNPVASLAASDFEGVWKVKDMNGKPFEITLSQNAAAKANRGEGMSGTWKEEDKTAVITWNTGWVTKIAKEGDRYKKSAYRKGQPLGGAPSNSSDAEKVK